MFFRVPVPVALLLLRFFFTAAPTLAEADFLLVVVALAGVARADEDPLRVAFLAADFLVEPDCAVRVGLAAGLLRAVALVPARLLAVSFVPARELRVVALRRSF